MNRGMEILIRDGIRNHLWGQRINRPGDAGEMADLITPFLIQNYDMKPRIYDIVPVGSVRKHDNAVGVRVSGGWTVVWTSFTDGTSERGYFYPDGSRTADWIQQGAVA